jgi:DNA polymerase III delta prime subunit
MSNNKELIRDMLNHIIKGETEEANEKFSDISYAYSQSKLGIRQDVATEVEEDDQDDQEDDANNE